MGGSGQTIHFSIVLSFGTMETNGIYMHNNNELRLLLLGEVSGWLLGGNIKLLLGSINSISFTNRL